MSSNFCSIWTGLCVAVEAVAFLTFCVPHPAAGADRRGALRCADVVQISGSELAPFIGASTDHLALVACGGHEKQVRCEPIPFQLDEVDAQGRWVLDQGPQPNVDDAPGVLDANDRVLFMASDAGQRANQRTLALKGEVAEISVRDPLSHTRTWVYLFVTADAAPRSPLSYVSYDPETDRVRGERVTLGFRHGVPGHLAVHGTDGALLDRFKVRATATFLWGLVHLSRNEDDVTTEFVAWRAGPIRVIRSQRQWVRIGWGIRSPTFGSYTYFYRDFAELPVGLRLNFRPTYFFGDIIVEAALDFRDLRGWSVILPHVPEPIRVSGSMTGMKMQANEQAASWFALCGPQATLVQVLDVSPSLATVRRRLLYREDPARADPPEDVPGQVPAIGYRLDQWEDVGAGAHQLLSTSYALPPDLDVRQFMRSRGVPLEVSVRMLP